MQLQQWILHQPALCQEQTAGFLHYSRCFAVQLHVFTLGTVLALLKAQLTRSAVVIAHRSLRESRMAIQRCDAHAGGEFSAGLVTRLLAQVLGASEKRSPPQLSRFNIAHLFVHPLLRWLALNATITWCFAAAGVPQACSQVTVRWLCQPAANGRVHGSPGATVMV